MTRAAGLHVPSEATLARLAAALLLPPVALGAWLGARSGSIDGLLGSLTVRIWTVAGLLALAAGGIVAARAGRRVRAAAWGGALAAASSFALAAGSGYSGVLEVGEGEPAGQWRARESGPFASVPSVEAVELPRDGGGVARLRVRGRAVEVRLMEEAKASAVRLRVTRVAPAYAFELRRQGGEFLDGLMVKLHPGEGNEFGFERLPHRVMAPLEATTSGVVAPPARLRLRVQRGKLSVADQVVRPGEPLAFEGLVLWYGGGARWARIEVRGGRPILYLIGAVLALLAAGAAWFGSREGRP